MPFIKNKHSMYWCPCSDDAELAKIEDENIIWVDDADQCLQKLKEMYQDKTVYVLNGNIKVCNAKYNLLSSTSTDENLALARKKGKISFVNDLSHYKFEKEYENKIGYELTYDYESYVYTLTYYKKTIESFKKKIKDGKVSYDHLRKILITISENIGPSDLNSMFAGKNEFWIQLASREETISRIYLSTKFLDGLKVKFRGEAYLKLLVEIKPYMNGLRKNNKEFHDFIRKEIRKTNKELSIKPA